MSVIYILITVSIIVAIVFLAAFITAVKSGQYQDSYTPSVRMLFEDEVVRDEKKREKEKEELTTVNKQS
ncbi:cytochrome oxidase maturation protein, cbb3-type [Sinomicrobium oceani]|uniref:Cytochrome oxidase maturation protein, cbb3-type n=1 Tax=Sinomicrobium oceani TaxID=1150368 RepID=A0A1K1MD34_9FLAO|nr:cbb3-type cytochrome oxidase assembly protein CcoS [Sinomicrobium oceani]SFW21066.1 cytochrome oxidase maturation protein, cbb3-type [Sinomicrobium oceani]